MYTHTHTPALHYNITFTNMSGHTGHIADFGQRKDVLRGNWCLAI